MATATRLPRLANGSIDPECGVTTNTAARQAKVAFSVTTLAAASRLLARKDSGVCTLEDLRGDSVVSTLSTTSIEHLPAENERVGLDVRILCSTTDADAFRRVRAPAKRSPSRWTTCCCTTYWRPRPTAMA